MEHIGTTICPQIITMGSGAQATVPTLCGLTADVNIINDVTYSMCPLEHIHALSASYVINNVTLD